MRDYYINKARAMQTNTQAHLGPQSVTKKQSFMTLVPGRVDHLEGRHHHPAEAVGHVPQICHLWYHNKNILIKKLLLFH